MKTQKLKQVDDYFLELRYKSHFLNSLYEFFNSHNIEFGFLGGSVRAAIDGICTAPRDLDIVFNYSDDVFDLFLNKLNIDYIKNSFGGRKIEVDNLKFDIWSLSKHHLISEKVYKQNFNNIPKTTFINYDSIFYNCTTHELIDNYSTCISKNTIDLIGNKRARSSNSKKDVTICKLALLKDKGFAFSNELNEFITDYLNQYFESLPLIDYNELLNCFLYNYKRHIGNTLDAENVQIIERFIENYL